MRLNQFTGPTYCPAGKYLAVNSANLGPNCSANYYPTLGCQCASACPNQYFNSNLTACVNACAGNEYYVNATSNATCISCGAQYVNSLKNGCIASCPTGEVLVGQKCTDPDCDSLISMWLSMNGSSSAFVNGVCCGKNNVTCDATNTFVTQISWTGASLSGVIPSNITNLTYLTQL